MYLGVARQPKTKRKRPSLLASFSSSIKPSAIAATFLLALELVHGLGVELPTCAREALALTGVSRSQAYEMKGRLRNQLEQLHESPGRPMADAPEPQELYQVASLVRDYVMDHPGSVHTRGARRSYTENFQRFVVALFGPSGAAKALPIEQAAHAISVPLGTLKDWLRSPETLLQNATVSDNLPTGSNSAQSTSQPQLATLISEYATWEGSLSAFCEYARTELRLPYGRSFITHALTAAGMHSPSVRNKPHQAPWSGGSMHAPFPGMQWFGDGKQLTIILHGQRFTFNLEALVDGASNAVVGARVTDAEDGLAVIQTFHEGLDTTGDKPPLAVTLDNRPSNFAPSIHQALSSTELLHSTPGRGQSKAPVEGSFGLFEQSLPSPMVITGDNDRAQARSVAQRIATAFFLGRNGRPRRKLGGHTPCEAYNQANPSQEQIDSAKRHILELRRRADLARRTREERADPVRRELLREQLKQLGIDDPAGEHALSLCGYAMGAILRGLSIYRTKKEQGSLPVEHDPYRYLGGIIRNVETSEYLSRVAEHLLELRLRAGDLQLVPLHRLADTIRTELPVEQAIRRYVDAALDADSELAFRFWRAQAQQALASIEQHEAIDLYRNLIRVIARASRLPRKRREQLIALLAEAVAPVAA